MNLITLLMFMLKLIILTLQKNMKVVMLIQRIIEILLMKQKLI